MRPSSGVKWQKTVSTPAKKGKEAFFWENLLRKVFQVSTFKTVDFRAIRKKLVKRKYVEMIGRKILKK